MAVIKLTKNIIKLVCILLISMSFIFTGCLRINSEQIEKTTDMENLQDNENASSSMETNSAGEFKEIPVDEAYDIFISDKDYLFIDVRSKESYEKSHIKGAINIPVSDIKENLDKIP